MKDSTLIEEIAQKEFELFVVNPYAIAIQQNDGKYITKYFQYDARLLSNMIKSHGSAGCYQQGYRNGLIKWICLDFDCKDKENPPVQELNEFLKRFVLQKLSELGIHYLTEFSGRRGIHVWVIFSEPVSKSIGYSIINSLMHGITVNTALFGLDKFPATDSHRGNKVGKQVKFPLSAHKNGGQSFFFENELDFNCIYKTSFYQTQLRYLQTYKTNDVQFVCKQLCISLDKDETWRRKNKKYLIKGDYSIEPAKIEKILSETIVFREIFQRLKQGTSIPRDWYVLLGTLGQLDVTGNLLNAIYALSPSYDECMTLNNVKKWKEYYFAATFDYLYDIYDLDPEPDLDLESTALEYCVNRCNELYEWNISIEHIETESEKKSVYDLETVIQKEINYIDSNDENIVISVWNKINSLDKYDLLRIQHLVDGICLGDITQINHKEYFVLNRVESPEKTRRMVVLGVEDRIITTYIAMRLGILKSYRYNSYSYNLSFLSKTDIFYNWYSSWAEYIRKIRSYIEVPYMNDWGVFSIDIQHFYDNIDFLAVYKLICGDLNEEEDRIFRFLVRYNEELMRRIGGERKGVPQGPAYARIIAEILLSTVLKRFIANNNSKEHFVLYRYVDDIIVFYEPPTDGEAVFEGIIDCLKSNGLEINQEKSVFYGLIGDLDSEQRNEILRTNKFNYGFGETESNLLKSAKEKDRYFRDRFDKEFAISDTAYMFSTRTDEEYRYKYFCKYKRKVFSSEYGRGSIFIRFYSFVFANDKYVMEAIEDGCFQLLPINSLNFKNCISTMYCKIQNGDINDEVVFRLCETYLSRLPLEQIEEEEHITINAILRWSSYDRCY